MHRGQYQMADFLIEFYVVVGILRSMNVILLSLIDDKSAFA